jgi:hypothetical protein
LEANKEGYSCLLSGGAPDSPVRHRTVTVDGPVPISFLFWRRRSLRIRGSWRTGPYPVPPADRWCVPRVARVLCGRPLSHLTVWCTPDSPVNYSHTPSIFPESGLFTGSQPGAPDTVRCARLSWTSAVHSQVTCKSFLLFFSLFLALRQNMLVLKIMY